MKNTTITPFVKWVGGKRQLISEIYKLLPDNFNAYHEPFIGGGALFFHLQPKIAFISDLNKELIDTYRAIRNDVNRVREYLILMEMGHNVVLTHDGDKDISKKTSPFYNKIRAIDLYKSFEGRKLNMKDSIYLRAARFIYLNKNTFNGLYRVNSSGHFNSPSKHKENQSTFIWENLYNTSQFLKTIPLKNFKTRTFDKCIQNVKRGDFVYLDPPYDYENNQHGFDSYQKNEFGEKGQRKLANFCKILDEMGVKFMLSNHNTKLIRELYSDFDIKIVKAKRMVGGKGASRNKVEEVLVRNYG